MTNFTVTDPHFTYEITTSCGKPSQIVRRSHENATGEVVEYDDLPFLVQVRIDSALSQQFDEVPKQLFVK